MPFGGGGVGIVMPNSLILSSNVPISVVNVSVLDECSQVTGNATNNQQLSMFEYGSVLCILIVNQSVVNV